jgi:hypothetical protein
MVSNPFGANSDPNLLGLLRAGAPAAQSATGYRALHLWTNHLAEPQFPQQGTK